MNRGYVLVIYKGQEWEGGSGMGVITLTPKGQMVFFEFWSGSHFLNLQSNLLLFLELEPLFEIYPGM